MWDFLRDLKDDLTFEDVLKLTDLHFELDCAIMYPMAWSICKLYAKPGPKQLLEHTMGAWFKLYNEGSNN